MCIIIYQPVGERVTEEHMRNSASHHPDGCGLAYINNKKRNVIYKTMDIEDFIDKYMRLREMFPKSPFLLHFRRKTVGSAKVENNHPFRVDSEYVFMHNGSVHDCMPPKDNPRDVSDTRLFNETVMRKMPYGWFRNAAIDKILESYIGTSKLAIMNRQGDVHILNSYLGAWHRGLWFSNDSFKSRAVEVIVHKKKDNHRHIHYNTPSNLPTGAYGSSVNDFGDDDDDTSDDYYEWMQDGLRMRCKTADGDTEAYDVTQGKWRAYDLVLCQFCNPPHTCQNHVPDSPLVDVQTKDKSKILIAYKCNMCHCISNLCEEYLVDEIIYPSLCPACVKVYRNAGVSVLRYKTVVD